MNTESGSALLAVSAKPLSPEELRRMDAYWRAANYLSVGQIYLFDNPLLREPLRPEHVKQHIDRCGEDMPEIRDRTWPPCPPYRALAQRTCCRA